MPQKIKDPVREVEVRSAADALLQSQQLQSYWSRESLLTQRLLIYVAELLEENNRLLTQRKRYYLPPRRTKRAKRAKK